MYVRPLNNSIFFRVAQRRGARCRAAPAVQLLQHRQIPEKIGPLVVTEGDIPPCFQRQLRLGRFLR